MVRRNLAAILGAAVIAMCPVVATAQDMRTATSKSSFDDVKFELNNAIVNRGLVVEGNGRLNDMLIRTGKDVGSEKPIYKHAEYVTFCSAKLSRQMMEADPANIAFCPYVIFMYESVNKPGEVVVGFRPPQARGDDKSKAALAEIDTLLSAIIKEAVK